METINHHTYHYFSHPVEGYAPVSLHRSGAKPLTMYYELQQFEKDSQQVADESEVRDFEHIDMGDLRAAEDIVIDRSAVVTDSQWVRKY